MRVLPRGMNAPRPDALRELRDFNRKPVWLALGIGAIGFAGMFCVFSYLAPTLVHVTGVRESFIPFGLVAFGIGGILGTLGGGWLFDRLQFRAAPVVLVWSIVVLLLFPLAAHSLWTVLPAVVAVGTMGALATVLQAHLMDVARVGADAGRRLQPLGLQHRQRAGPVARRHGDHRRLRLDLDRRGRRGHRGVRPADLRLGAPGRAARTSAGAGRSGLTSPYLLTTCSRKANSPVATAAITRVAFHSAENSADTTQCWIVEATR